MKFCFIILTLILLHEVATQTSSCDENESKLAAVTNLICNGVITPTTRVKKGKKGPKGDKGDPGVNCDVIDKVEMLESENKALKQNMSTLQRTFDDFVTKINEKFSDYTFEITPNRGNFDDCRKQCQSMGGDIIHVNFGKNGLKYHAELRKMMESSGKNLWVGFTDRETEGTFKYLNGETVNAHVSQGETLLYYFKGGEPNGDGGRGDCVHYVPPVISHYNNALNDVPCDVATNLWGHGVDFHGLCEIRHLFYKL